MLILHPDIAGDNTGNANSSSRELIAETQNELNNDQLTQLDMLTMVKASHALSTEIQLENYLASMLGIMVENADEDKGFLFFKEGQHWVAKPKALSPQEI